EERPALVERLVEHPIVERQPGELPVQERHGGDGRRRGGGERRGRLRLGDERQRPFAPWSLLVFPHGSAPEGTLRIPFSPPRRARRGCRRRDPGPAPGAR